MQGGYFRVTTAGNLAKEKISSPTLTMEHPGFIYVFLYNRSNSANWVYFDDLKVTHQRSPIVAGADFYPFGLPMEGREITQEDYRWGYQGQYAERDTVTGWKQFQLRMYDARFGRWLSVDPYGQYASPYLAMGNVPNMFGDSDGGWSLPMAGVGFAVGAGIGYAVGGDLKSALIGGAIGGLALGASFDNINGGVSKFNGGVSKFNGGFRETGTLTGFKPSQLLASTANFIGEYPGVFTGLMRAGLNSQRPPMVNLKGNSNSVLEGLVQWSEYLTEKKMFGVRRREDGSPFSVRDMVYNVPDDASVSQFNTIRSNGNLVANDGTIFTWSIPDKIKWSDLTNRTYFNIYSVKPNIQSAAHKPLLQINFVGGGSSKGGDRKVFVLTVHGKEAVNKYGKRIFGSDWSKMSSLVK